MKQPNIGVTNAAHFAAERQSYCNGQLLLFATTPSTQPTVIAA